MKMFEVLHLDVHDGAIVRNVGTYHGVHQPITNLSGSQDGLVNKTKMWFYNQLKLWGPLRYQISPPHLQI
jgi:hypothetical protein